jgi:hypothetical protein
LAALVLAACGGAAAPAVVGVTPPRGAEPGSAAGTGAGASGSGSAGAGESVSGGAGVSGSASAGAGSSAAAIGSASAASVPRPRPTSLADKLTALQLDPQDLPSFDELTPTQLRGVMKLFAESLHAKCVDCHETDFSVPTRRKKIAVHMWNDLARRFTTVSGDPVFCDSCHQQQIKPLMRTDDAALRAGMQASFVSGLKRKDPNQQAAEMACTACHVSEQDFALLDKWSR